MYPGVQKPQPGRVQYSTCNYPRQVKLTQEAQEAMHPACTQHRHTCTYVYTCQQMHHTTNIQVHACIFAAIEGANCLGWIALCLLLLCLALLSISWSDLSCSTHSCTSTCKSSHLWGTWVEGHWEEPWGGGIWTPSGVPVVWARCSSASYADCRHGIVMNCFWTELDRQHHLFV